MGQEINQMAGDIRLMNKQLREKILKDHPQLEYCGKCPFLMIELEYLRSYDCPEKHTSGVPWMEEQQNTCLLMCCPDLWDIDESGKKMKINKEYHVNWLEYGKNPKRNEQCLDFTMYNYIQFIDYNKGT